MRVPLAITVPQARNGPSVKFRSKFVAGLLRLLRLKRETNDFVSEYTRSQMTAVANANVDECNVSERSYKHPESDNFLQFGYERVATFL